jgi:hypothetical protein
MPMYLFGDKESNSKDLSCFPSYHGNWSVNDWSLGGTKEINELVQMAVGWVGSVGCTSSFSSLQFYEGVEEETIIQTGPFQLWLFCCFCCSTSEPVEIQEQALRVNFHVLTKALDETGTREYTVLEHRLLPLTDRDSADVVKLLERYVYVYKNNSMNCLDVAVHVADVINVVPAYGKTVDMNGNIVLSRTICSAEYDIENIKEYGK